VTTLMYRNVYIVVYSLDLAPSLGGEEAVNGGTAVMLAATNTRDHDYLMVR
jgi:hypothetical protein